MAWNTADEIAIAGTGEAYVADEGTALPATVDTALPDANWEGLGYHTEDGFSVAPSLEVVEHRAWQKKLPIRIDRDTSGFAITFVLLQWNETTVPLAFGGGEIVSDGSSGFRYNPPDDEEALLRKTVVVDAEDGDDKIRFVVEAAQIVEGFESQFTRNAMAGLPITLRAVEPLTGNKPWYALFNEARFATGS